MQADLDPGRVAALAVTHGLAMRAFAQRLGLDADRAEDTVQETLLRLWAEVDQGRLITDPKAWAYRVLYRTVMDAHRDRQRSARIAERLRPPMHMMPPDAGALDDASVWAEVDRLTPRQREVLHLRFIADLPFDTVGVVLGISPSAARAHATFGVQALRSRIADRDDLALPPRAATQSRSVTGGDGQGGGASRSDVVRLGNLEAPPGGLTEPGGIDIDPDGRIWVVDTGRDAIAIFAPTGSFLEHWGRPGSQLGRFSFRRALGPVGDLRFARDGSFFVVDNGNYRVQRFDRERQFIGSFGVFGSGDGQFLDPWSVRIDGADRLYVSDAIREDIQVFTFEGTYLRTIGRGGDGPGQLRFQGDAVPVGDEIYVADHWNARISVFGTDGTFRRIHDHPLLAGPDGIDVDATGNLVAADSTGRRFVVISPIGEVIHAWKGDSWLVRVLPDRRILTSGVDGVAIYRTVNESELTSDLSVR
ncbi:MAG: sigma-70 family RNA polymerase sigma factor [Candidatus Limnocylindrales bacterium]